MPNYVNEAINLTYGGSIKPVISEMSNMELKSKSRGGNYNKEEKMWNDCSDNTLAFPKLNNMKEIISRVQVGHSWQ